VSSSRRLDALRAVGVEYVAGVPCTYLAKFFAGCSELPADVFLPAVREDHAVSACAGAWLAGRLPLAAMQNSGLGYCLEVLTSLHLMNRIPLLMLVSDRGAPTDYEEHRILGQATRQLLDLFAIPWRDARVGNEDDDARWLAETASRERKPAVLLIAKEADS
jgi:sulfopyruvate decarboxylase TPP-binding subunit